jgi:3-phenylpropionate/cinnamic acid dioxygenase small subunit
VRPAQPFNPVFDPDTLRHVEQFYYREARLLDERQYLQWLTLLSPDIRYVLPARFIPLARGSTRDPESIHALDNELSGYDPGGLPIREESYGHLAQRAARALKPNAWAENPPPRTRRFVTNIEIEHLPGGGIRAFSNLQMFHSQNGRPDHIFAGQRRDRLDPADASYRIAEREVILDSDIVRGASVALFF